MFLSMIFRFRNMMLFWWIFFAGSNRHSFEAIDFPRHNCMSTRSPLAWNFRCCLEKVLLFFFVIPGLVISGSATDILNGKAITFATSYSSTVLLMIFIFQLGSRSAVMIHVLALTVLCSHPPWGDFHFIWIYCVSWSLSIRFLLDFWPSFNVRRHCVALGKFNMTMVKSDGQDYLLSTPTGDFTFLNQSMSWFL